MTATSYLKPTLPNMGASQVNYAFGSLDLDRASSLQQPPMFKKHKVLPHPKKESLMLHDVPRSMPQRFDLEIDTRASQSSASLDSSSSRRRRSKRLPGGPEPPPTPPAHSRKSSSSHSVNRPSPPHAGSPLNSAENVQPPTTPTNQQTPPTPNLTPDRTPPGPTTRHAKPRPAITDRIPSKVTIESRTESFRTAPENPYSSDDDDGVSTLRPRLSSAKTSQSTVRQINGEGKSKPQLVGLGLGLESSPGEDLTPRTAREFNTFDGEWVAARGGSGSEVEEEWDYNLGRNVIVKKRRPGNKTNGHKYEVIDDMPLTPTNATKALRSMSLQESPIVYPFPRRVFSDKVPVQQNPSASASSISTDFKRSSILSTRSTVSTVVEAILVETAPQRRKTLRHVRKQPTLRELGSEYSPASSAPTWASASGSVTAESTRRRLSNPKLRDAPRESYASNATTNSISSRKARRDVWKNGGIPVVVLPERQSSVKSSREPSLRSTSSRKSKRSNSLGSGPLSQLAKGKEYVNHSEAPRRSRTVSETDGSRPGDQRTIDYPPVVPTRSSSLSAPTSQNGSRTASLTAESLQAHSALHAQQVQQTLQKANGALSKREEPNARPELNRARGYKQPRPEAPEGLIEARERRQQPEVRVHRVPSIESGKLHDSHYLHHTYDFHGLHSSHEDHDGHRHRLSVDRYGDPFFGKRLSVQNTPFSQASVDTNATSHAEVSEAMAVTIYPHQNKSLVMVDHSTKPSESSSLDRYRSSDLDTPSNAGDENTVPVTPPQTFSMDDVDSPLRNPRAPPEPPAGPPAINFIPATPSGMTPMVEKEKQLGNFYEMAAEEKPARAMSLLKRTLTRRRNSEYGPSPARPVGFLTRTFSLTRSIRRGGNDHLDGKRPVMRRHSMIEDKPDESRLHPHWRPAHFFDTDSEGSDWDDEEGPDGRTYKYPPIDNRPRPPLRSLSQRMKRTFAILPVRDYDDGRHYFVSKAEEERDMPARRTIRRTPSGNLRVMKFRRSLESLPRIEPNNGRPYTAPEEGGGGGRAGLRLWRLTGVPSWIVSRAPGDGRGGGGFLPALGNRMNLTRRFSEKRRQKKSQELKRMISGPREVRDGVGDVIRRNSYHR